MNRKVTYQLAVRILTAFLGSDIIVEEKGKGKMRTCIVSSSNLAEDNKLIPAKIIERETWEEVLIDLLPRELTLDKQNRPFHEVGYVSTVYRFRQVGKAIKERSRSRLQGNACEAGEASQDI